jgi:succinate dehydrogenase / fumarate reductase, cytochrome b subunit
MSNPTGSRRPLSPFMIGPYYRPQLTSMLSITHRACGVVLTAGMLLVTAWLLALAAGPDAYGRAAALAAGPFGRVVLLGLGFCLVFHLLNGLRHLFWDAGKGLDIPTTYASGWAVLALSLVATAALAWCLFFAGGAA